MRFFADLHVHSRYSRATGRDADLQHFALWARRKGLTVVGTGDFTHPAWFRELREQLQPAEPGLLQLRPDLAAAVEARVPPACAAAVSATRFALEVEISTIYKKGDRTRKVHHVVFVPDLDAAEKLAQRLVRIGNLGSDGRPILGLDSRALLEITLEAGEGAFLIPAHIWTPWFSALGSKSGFDSIEECYGELADHIFALETGLSSDPAMNWRVSRLDRYRLVSNSDAHSPAKLAREACVFDTALDYFALRRALATGEGYAGTVEFFPEEGKYHLDGHRKCNVRLTPPETRRQRGLCPACGKPLTVGVMSRVEELADRPESARLPGAAPFRSFIPLTEILGELFGVGPDSGKVEKAYEGLLAQLGPELYILEQAPLESLARAGSPRLAEALDRMRRGAVIREAGYDGEYGTIRLFAPGEQDGEKDAKFLFEMPAPPAPSVRETPPAADDGNYAAPSAPPPCAAESGPRGPETSAPELHGVLAALDPEQRAAAEIVAGPLLIVAGPGTGKTRTLTHRLAHLVLDCGAAPEQCLAIAFTNRAAAEMRERLQRLLPGRAQTVPVMTFHALGYRILREHAARLNLPPNFRVAAENDLVAALKTELKLTAPQARQWLARLAARKRGGAEAAKEAPDPSAQCELRAAYERILRARGWVDFDDLIRLPLELLETHEELAELYRQRYRWISIDEYQDVDERQYRLLKRLAPPDGNLCAIGDPDQAIYGFRGGDVRFFGRFTADFPAARVAHLIRNYRSGRAIVGAALQVIAPASLAPGRALQALSLDTTRIAIHAAPTDKAEAEFVVHTIEQLISGTTFFSLDSERATAGEGEALGFSDIAVLYRMDAQAEPLVTALARSGLPYQKRAHGPLREHPAVCTLVDAMHDKTAGDDAVGRSLDAALAGLGDEYRREALALAPVLEPLAARCGSLDEFLSELALMSDADLWDPRADAISLLTLHSAKGLEFPVVFIVGCEDGLLPLRWQGAEDIDPDEERRLFFVGITRAKRRLLLAWAQRRLWLGQMRERQPSPFLRAIEEELLEARRGAGRRRRRAAGEQLDLLPTVGGIEP